jgi:glycosyltransferase involved in cell wall biosynthesis
MLPLVTIAIPNYNYSRYIVEALDSVATQQYPNIELLVLDDQSTDNSVAVINEWIHNYRGNIQVKLLRQQCNGGLTKACNKLLQHATGKYIQFLDADDKILPEKISSQVAILEEQPSAALVYADALLIDEYGKEFGQGYLQRIGFNSGLMPSGDVHTALFHFNFIPLPTILVRTDLIRQAGGFDEAVGVQDYYMWLILSARYQFLYQHTANAFYRVHHASMSNSSITNPSSVRSILEIKYKYFDSGSEQIRQAIRGTIASSAPYLYRYQHPDAKKWIRLNWIHNPSVKNLVQYCFICLGLPYVNFGIVKKGI